jgi:hypothetical protein
MDRAVILMAEYAEAGHSCRAQESYVRATLNMYLVLGAGIAVLLASVSMPIGVRAYICFGAFAVGLCMLLLVLRHRSVYAAFAERAREIETELGISLYSHAKSKMFGSGEATAKTLSAFIIGVIAVAFLAAALFFASKAT